MKRMRFGHRGQGPWPRLWLLLITGSLVGLAEAAIPGQDPPFPRHYPEVGITVLDEWITDLEWSRDGRWIAYSRWNPVDWYTDIWVVRPDGTDRRCVTCGPDAPAKHNGSVAFHPGGRFLVFAAENEDVRSRKADRLALPGFGLNTNLWAATADGSQFWQLTDEKTDTQNPRGVISPRFSPDGKRLFWAGLVGHEQVQKGHEWGEWALFFADVDVHTGAPVLNNVRMLQPGDQHGYYESDDWSPDGRRVLFSANLVPGQPIHGLDIYELTLDTGALRRLTHTDGDWDAHAHYSPDGRQIIWMSSRGLHVHFRSVDQLTWVRDIKTELWIMDRDGTGARRLTGFNHTFDRDSRWFHRQVFAAGRVAVTDCAWDPGSARAALAVGFETRSGLLNAVLAIVDLERRYP
jgi:Tol biopolymer transport system component